MSFSAVLVLLVPVFGLMGLGWAAAASRTLPVSVGDALGSYAATIALPVLLFRALATAHFPPVSPWPLWITYFTGVTVAWGLGHLAYRRLFKGDARLGIVAGVSSAFSNTAMIGIPLVFTAYGPRGDAPLLFLLSIHLPVMTIAATLMFERIEMAEAGHGRMSWGHFARRVSLNIVRNPIAIGIAAGALARWAGLSLDGPFGTIVHELADTAVPCALFALGMSLKRYGLRDHLGASSVIVVLKLVVMPAVVLVMARYVFGLPPVWTGVATVVAGASTGVNAYLIASRAGAGVGLACNAITLSTVAATLTTGVWLSLAGGG